MGFAFGYRRLPEERVTRREGTVLVDGGVDTGPKLGRASRLDPCLGAAPGSHGQRWHCPGGRCVGRSRRAAWYLRGLRRGPEVMLRAGSGESAQAGRLPPPWTDGVEKIRR